MTKLLTSSPASVEVRKGKIQFPLRFSIFGQDRTLVGIRLRGVAASNLSIFMEGKVQACTNNSFTLDVDMTQGIGMFRGWDFYVLE